MNYLPGQPVPLPHDIWDGRRGKQLLLNF